MKLPVYFFLQRASLALIVAIPIFIISCQGDQRPWNETGETQVPSIDTTLFVDLTKQKLISISDSTPYDLKGAKIYADKAINQFYQMNNFLPLWKSREMYTSYIQILDSIQFDGLLSQDYDLSLIKSLYIQIDTANSLDHNALSDLDIITTNSFLLLILHLLEGKSEPKLLDPNWNYNFSSIDKHSIDSVYGFLSRGNIETYFHKIRTRSEYYLEMQNTLKQLYRLKKAGGWKTIDFDKDVKLEPRETSPLIPIIRQRLASSLVSTNGSENQTDDFYDSVLVSKVSAFQKQHGLLDDGIVGQRTLEAMNISVDEKIDQVRVNMERARWLVNDLIQKRIVVNIASFNAYLFDGDERSYSSKVMVGKPYTKTPVFESTLKYAEINPTWTVPRSIVVNEMLPRIKRDPDYLRNRNMVLLNSQGQVVLLENVDLEGSFPYSIRQGPGPGNALGRVKFIFPNSFSVYLHDTPSRSLFVKSARAFSHGCIRVENPLEWAEILINDPEWDQESINKVVRSGKTTRVFPKEDIRVMIVYFTHLTDLDGTVYFYPDIYERDQPVLDVLNAPIDDQVLNYKRTEIIKRIEE